MTTLFRTLSTMSVLLSGIALAGNPPNTTLVPPEFLKANALQLTDGNSTVPPPPGEGWRWLRAEFSGHPVFLCVNDGTPEVLTVSAHSYGATKVSPRFLSGFLRGVEKSATKQQRNFRSLGPLPPPTPDSSAVGFSYSLETPEGQLQHAFGYVIPTGRLTVIQALTAHATAPDWLPALATSVRPLRSLSLEEAFPAVRVASWAWPHLLLGAVAWGAIRLINRSQRRRPLNPWTAVLVAILVTTLIDVLILLRSNIFENMMDNQPAEAFGMVTGVPIVLLLVSGYLRYRDARHEAMKAVAA